MRLCHSKKQILDRIASQYDRPICLFCKGPGFMGIYTDKDKDDYAKITPDS